MSGVMTPSRRLSSTTTRGTPPSWRKARSCSSAQIARRRLPRQQPHRLAAVPERQHEEPHALVLAALADRAPSAPRRSRPAPPRQAPSRSRPAPPAAPSRAAGHEALHAGVLALEAVVVDQVLPDRHRVAAAGRRPPRSPRGTARTRSPPAPGLAAACAAQSRWTPPAGGRFCPAESVDTSRWWPVLPDRVGGHPHAGGRFWRPDPRAAARGSHRDPRRAQVTARRLPTDPCLRFDPAQRPSQSPQRHYLLSSVLAQDVCHPGAGPQVPRLRQRLGALLLVAGFQVSISGRFWVSTEDNRRRAGLPLSRIDFRRQRKSHPRPGRFAARALCCDHRDGRHHHRQREPAGLRQHPHPGRLNMFGRGSDGRSGARVKRVLKLAGLGAVVVRVGIQFIPVKEIGARIRPSPSRSMPHPKSRRAETRLFRLPNERNTLARLQSHCSRLWLNSWWRSRTPGRARRAQERRSLRALLRHPCAESGRQSRPGLGSARCRRRIRTDAAMAALNSEMRRDPGAVQPQPSSGVFCEQVFGAPGG